MMIDLKLTSIIVWLVAMAFGLASIITSVLNKSGLQRSASTSLKTPLRRGFCFRSYIAVCLFNESAHHDRAAHPSQMQGRVKSRRSD